MLALFGARVPVGLKVFLMALAVLDDLGAIVIIALFYTSDLSLQALALAAVALAVLFALNRAGVTRVAPYVLVGAALWLCVLKSGVHATLAGVVTALFVPATRSRRTRSIRRCSGWSTRCTRGWRSASCRSSPSPMRASPSPA